MWMLFHRIQRALSQRPLMWMVRLLLLTFAVLLTIGTWWIGTSILHDQQRQASMLSIDVVLGPEIDASSGNTAADDCAQALKRRPDVASAVALGKRSVWLLFQYELGLQAGGLTDVAAMPSVIQVRLKPEYAGLRNAKIVRDYALRNHRDIIDRVLLPERAFADSDKLVADTQDVRSGVLTLTLGLFIMVFIVVMRSAWTEMIAPSVNLLLGRSAQWGMSSVILLVSSMLILACAMAYATLTLFVSRLYGMFPWLEKLSNVFGM